MNNEEINKAIAEACGFKYVALGLGWKHITGGEMQCRIPDYYNDLNAMHDAENTLTDENREKYATFLSQIFTAPSKKAWWDLSAKETFEIVTATAKQKAEAFRKTLGRWEESPKSARELANEFGIDKKTESLKAEEVRENHFVAN